VTTVGLLCLFAEWGWPGLLASATTIALFAVVFSASGWANNDRRAGARAAWRTAVVGVLLVAATGLLAVFHAAGFAVLVLLVLSSPRLVSEVRQRITRVPETGSVAPKGGRELSPPGDDVLPSDSVLRLPADLRTLDDEALCLAWRRTFLRLGQAGSAEEKMLVVVQRATLLDELHRRSPDGLAAWWTSGGRASSSPLLFLDPRRSRTDPGTGE
jgi:hypothetical protein